VNLDAYLGKNLPESSGGKSYSGLSFLNLFCEVREKVFGWRVRNAGRKILATRPDILKYEEKTRTAVDRLMDESPLT
jgi:hypothetical protein